MSARLVQAAWAAPRLRPSARLVLVYLAWRANDSGCAFPALETIARDTGLSRRHVIRLLRLLSVHGLIARGPETVGGRGRTAIYRVLPQENSDRRDAAASPAVTSAAPRTSPASRNGDLPARAIRKDRQETPEERRASFSGEQCLASEKQCLALEEGSFAPWREMRRKLAHCIPPHSFSTWITPLRCRGVERQTLQLTAPNRAFTHVGEKFHAEFLAAARAAGLPVERVQVRVDGRGG